MTNEELEVKYNHLFHCNEYGVPVREIETPDAWNRIVEWLLNRFEWIRTHNTTINQIAHVIQIFQIKEKFGEFVCYVDVIDSENDMVESQLSDAIAFANGQALLTCSSCGRVGNKDGSILTPTKGYIAYLCEECKNESSVS